METPNTVRISHKTSLPAESYAFLQFINRLFGGFLHSHLYSNIW